MQKKRSIGRRSRSISKGIVNGKCGFSYNSRCSFSDNFRGNSASRRGQVTVFIILGLVILIAGVLFILFQQEILTFKPGDLLATEEQKVKNFMANCLADIGEEALFTLGLQGGYINVPVNIKTDESQHLALSPAVVVPFWANGVAPLIPTLQDIKLRLDDYIEANVPSCVLQDEAFPGYEFVQKSQVDSETIIGKGGVAFNLNWNIDVLSRSGETITTISKHTAESPIKLKDVYETASLIMEREIAEQKVEDITQDLIALEKVPMAGTEISCNRKEWKVEEVKQDLLELLRVNIKRLQVEGTSVIEYPDSLPYYQNHYVWNIGDLDELEDDVSVIFSFSPNYPLTFQVTPQRNGIMSSGSLAQNQIISNLCLQSWKFTYDVEYPVLVKVKDDTTNYEFNIAFMVHLIRNIPNRAERVIPRENLILGINSDTYCGQQRVPMVVKTWEVVDNGEGVFVREPLEDADISMTCLKYRCDIGKSEFDFAQSGYQAGGIYNFPFCVGGIVRAKREGYIEDWQRVVTKNGKEVELSLVPLKKFPVAKLNIKNYKQSGENIEEVKLDDVTTSVRLIFAKNTTKPVLFGENFHVSQYVISKATDEKILEKGNLEFLAEADFTYEVEVNIFDDEKLIGGYRGNWTADWDELLSAESLESGELEIRTIVNDGQDAFTFLNQLGEKSKLVGGPIFNE